MRPPNDKATLAHRRGTINNNPHQVEEPVLLQTSTMKNIFSITLLWIINHVGEVPGLPEKNGQITINQKQNGALFIQVGTLANGLAYGHITTTVDFNKLREQIKLYEHIVINLTALKEKFLGRQKRAIGQRAHQKLCGTLIKPGVIGNLGPTPAHKMPYIERDAEFITEFEHLSPQSPKADLSQATIISEQIEGLIHWIQIQMNETHQAIDNTLASFEKAGAVAKNSRSKRHSTGRHIVTFTRTKRGAGLVVGAAIGITALGGIISSLFSHFSTSDLEAVIEEQTNVLAAQIEENIVQFAKVNRDIKLLNSSLGDAMSAVTSILNSNNGRDLQHIALYHAWGITENLRKIRKAIHGIIEAHQGHFSSDLVKPDALQKALTTMRNKAIENGKEIGIRTLADVYSLSTSYLYEVEEQKVYIIIHCPISDIGKDLNLFRYVAAPLVWETEKETEHPFVEIGSTKEYIGLSKDQTMYRTFTADDLEECLKIEQVHFCDNLATYKVARPSCLSGLIMNKMDMVRQHCQINTKADSTRVVRLNASHYALISSISDTLSVQCPDSAKNTPYGRGTTLIELEPGCTANTREVKIERARFEPPINIQGLITSDPIKLVDIAPEQTEREIENLLQVRKELGQIGQPIPLSELKNLQDFQDKFQAASRSTILGSTIPTFVIIIGIIITAISGIYCLKKNTKVLDFVRFQKEVRHCCHAHRAEDLVGAKPPHFRYCTDEGEGWEETSVSTLAHHGSFNGSFNDSGFNPRSTFTMRDSHYSLNPNPESERGLKRSVSMMKKLNSSAPSAPVTIPEELPSSNSIPAYQLNQNAIV